MKRTEKLRQKNNTRVVHERTKEEREPTFRRRVTPLVIIALLFGLTYLLFFSGVFNIDEIEVKGYSSPELIEEIIISHTVNHYHKSNLILFDTGELEEVIKGDSGVRSINIKKIYPKTLCVEIEESTPKIIWISRGENYEIDDRGYVIGINRNNNIPTVYDLLNIETGLGERVASPTFINYIIILNESFQKVAGAEMDKIIIYDILSDVRVKSKDSWTVYLNASKDPVSQLENLSRVLAEAEKAGNKKVEYIDMRLETRIFYK